MTDIIRQIESLEESTAAANLELIKAFKSLDLDELRKEAQLRGVTEVWEKDQDSLVEAIFERKGERLKQVARFCGKQ